MSLVNVGYPSIINFYYTQDGSSEHAMSHFGAYEPRGWSGMTSNPIDGPRGEHIQSVQVAQRHANVCALKVRLDLEAIIEFGRLTSKPTQLITNNGKILESGTTSPPKPFPPYPGAPMPEKEAEAELETLRVAPGTTITGFYASHVSINFT